MSRPSYRADFATPTARGVAPGPGERFPGDAIASQAQPPRMAARHQLVAENLLSNRTVIVGGAGASDLDRISTWVEAMGGVPRGVSRSALLAASRRHAPNLAVIVLFEPACSEARSPALYLLRAVAPAAAMIRICETAGPCDFDGRRPGPFDATLHPRLSRVSFSLGVAAALSNAARRCRL